MKNSISFFVIFLFSGTLLSQPFNISLNKIATQQLQQKLYSTANNIHTAYQPYFVNELTENLTDSINMADFVSELNFNKSVENKYCRLAIAPVVDFITGFEHGTNNFIGYGAAGASISGSTKTKFAFNLQIIYFSALYTDAYHQIADSNNVIPHLGTFHKLGKFRSTFFFPFYFNYRPTSNFIFQVGYGKHFIGDGYRSLFLSTNSNNHFYSQIAANFWKIKYIARLSFLQDAGIESKKSELKQNYSATHFLSYNISKRLNINLFETVIWHSRDSVGFRGLDANYLNPAVFYRPVEFSLGSPDNVLLGIGFKLRLWNETNLYGQFLLDEFLLAEIKARNKWWANKFAVQIGMRQANLLNINGLSILAECNIVRPYTYSHINTYENYGSFHQPLAHPFGANFKELVLVLNYEAKRLKYNLKCIIADYGIDNDSISYGMDIYKSYNMRNSDYGIEIGQGTNVKNFYSELSVNYLISNVYKYYAVAGIYFEQKLFPAENKTNVGIYIGFRNALFSEQYSEKPY